MLKVIGMAGFMIGSTIIAYEAISRMPPEAVAMAIGILFGILAGVPMALLVMASSDRAKRKDVAAEALYQEDEEFYSDRIVPVQRRITKRNG